MVRGAGVLVHERSFVEKNDHKYQKHVYTLSLFCDLLIVMILDMKNVMKKRSEWSS